MVPSDAFIINIPDDGSAFAFAADGLRTYFRHTRDYDVSYEAMESNGAVLTRYAMILRDSRLFLRKAICVCIR